ncbi:MAG: peptide-N-glycosidase F-related protein [Oligoflexales bacterium]
MNESFEKIILEFELGCPNNRCDWWDRPGDLTVIQKNEKGEDVAIEILRFMTPYRVAGKWQVDVTHLRPILAGNVKFQVYIRTYVSRGHANGDGWLASARFLLKRGTPAIAAKAVIPIWNKQMIFYGDPKDPSNRAKQVKLPNIPFQKMLLATVITGHGQGNLSNCAEFCPKTHTMKVNDTELTKLFWRDDCNKNPINNQMGTWMFSRAGWCPGDIVKPWVEEVLAPQTDDATVTVTYEPEPYVNTCRPGAEECDGCTLGANCTKYNGQNHTPPHFFMSSVLILAD